MAVKKVGNVRGEPKCAIVKGDVNVNTTVDRATMWYQMVEIAQEKCGASLRHIVKHRVVSWSNCSHRCKIVTQRCCREHYAWSRSAVGSNGSGKLVKLPSAEAKKCIIGKVFFLCVLVQKTNVQKNDDNCAFYIPSLRTLSPFVQLYFF
eukprot:284819848_4